MSTGARAMCIVWHVHRTCKMVRPLSVFKPAKFDTMQTALPLREDVGNAASPTKRPQRQCGGYREKATPLAMYFLAGGQRGGLRSESFSSTDTTSLASPPGDPYFDTPDFNTPETVDTPTRRYRYPGQLAHRDDWWSFGRSARKQRVPRPRDSTRRKRWTRQHASIGTHVNSPTETIGGALVSQLGNSECLDLPRDSTRRKRVDTPTRRYRYPGQLAHRYVAQRGWLGRRVLRLA